MKDCGARDGVVVVVRARDCGLKFVHSADAAFWLAIFFKHELRDPMRAYSAYTTVVKGGFSCKTTDTRFETTTRKPYFHQCVDLGHIQEETSLWLSQHVFDGFADRT